MQANNSKSCCGSWLEFSQYAFQIARDKIKNIFLKKQVFFNSYFKKNPNKKILKDSFCPPAAFEK